MKTPDLSLDTKVLRKHQHSNGQNRGNSAKAGLWVEGLFRGIQLLKLLTIEK